MPVINRGPGSGGFDPFRDTRRAQDLSRESVTAFGESIRPQFLRDIGDTLGGLNSIGALRSGGTKVALDELSSTFADRIGIAARQATGDALGFGLQASRLRFDREEAKKRRKASLLSSIGSVVGAGIGFLAGGPPGAAAGGAVGGAAGNAASGGNARTG